MARTIRKADAKEVPLSDCQLENDPRFLRRIKQARASACAGLGVRLEDIEE
jgi:phage-related baseplate assembly protein